LPRLGGPCAALANPNPTVPAARPAAFRRVGWIVQADAVSFRLSIRGFAGALCQVALRNPPAGGGPGKQGLTQIRVILADARR
jgi:hypothetical protein